jgi:hypothetical protein
MCLYSYFGNIADVNPLQEIAKISTAASNTEVSLPTGGVMKDKPESKKVVLSV